jgi:multiple sugar transport system substrate-binding protein
VRKESILLSLLWVFLLSLVFSIVHAQEITLQVWDVFDPATSKDAVEREKLFRKFEEENPGIKIQHNILTYSDLHEKLVVAGVAGSGPDVVHMLGEWVPEFVLMGIVEDVTERVNAWNEKQFFPDSTWKVATYKDRIYGIPSIASPRVLLYREDYLKKAGFDRPPDTWDELKTVAQKVTGVVEGVYGFGFCSSSNAIRGPQEFLPLLWQTGAEWVVEKDGKWLPGFTVTQAEEVFALYNDLMNTLKACPPDSIGWEWQELDNAFTMGRIAMCYNGSWMQLHEEEAGESFKYWKGTRMPANKNRATYFEVKVEGIGKFSKYKDEAWKFLTWLLGKDQMALHTRHDNLPARTDVISLPEFQEDEWKKPFFAVIPDGKSFPPIPMSESNKAMMRELQAVLYQQKTPAEAAESLLATLQEILETINE